MKKLLFVLLAITIVLPGCAAYERMTDPNAPPPVSNYCPPPEGTKSFICEKSAELKITPEQAYGWIFSASAIAVVTDITDIAWICEFKEKIDQRYLRMYPLSYDSALAEVISELKLVDDPRKVLLIKNILNQNLYLYSSPALIDPYDDLMLRAGSIRFDRDMMCEEGK